MLPAQVRRSTGQIRIPDAAREGDYDLICFGSPTWFFTTNMPLRSYLKSAEAGKMLAGKRFAAYVVCRRYWSINLKEVRKLATAQGGATNLQPDFTGQAQAFANKLADSLDGGRTTPDEISASGATTQSG